MSTEENESCPFDENDLTPARKAPPNFSKLKSTSRAGTEAPSIHTGKIVHPNRVRHASGVPRPIMGEEDLVPCPDCAGLRQDEGGEICNLCVGTGSINNPEY